MCFARVRRAALRGLRDVLRAGPERSVQTATRYLLGGVTLSQAERIARELLANDLCPAQNE